MKSKIEEVENKIATYINDIENDTGLPIEQRYSISGVSTADTSLLQLEDEPEKPWTNSQMKLFEARLANIGRKEPNELRIEFN